jgi:hypothetical protein
MKSSLHVPPTVTVSWNLVECKKLFVLIGLLQRRVVFVVGLPIKNIRCVNKAQCEHIFPRCNHIHISCIIN